VIGPADSVPVLAIGLVTKDFKVSASIRSNSWIAGNPDRTCCQGYSNGFLEGIFTAIHKGVRQLFDYGQKPSVYEAPGNVGIAAYSTGWTKDLVLSHMLISSDLAMISPTDTAYPVLAASPTASELVNSYTPNVFELKFAEERTRQAAPRVALLVLLKTFQRLGGGAVVLPFLTAPPPPVGGTFIHIDDAWSGMIGRS
jgi:hypothetical protein